MRVARNKTRQDGQTGRGCWRCFLRPQPYSSPNRFRAQPASTLAAARPAGLLPWIAADQAVPRQYRVRVASVKCCPTKIRDLCCKLLNSPPQEQLFLAEKSKEARFQRVVVAWRASSTARLVARCCLNERLGAYRNVRSKRCSMLRTIAPEGEVR